MRSVQIGPNEAGQRLDKFLHKYMREAPGSFFYKMMRKKNIVLNGGRCTGSEKLALGDCVKLFLAEETLEKFGAPPALPEKGQGQGDGAGIVLPEYDKAFRQLTGIRVLYEDADILALDKPAGVLSQKAAPGDLSANEWLTGYLLQGKALKPEALVTFRPSVCNRLDRNTSGLLLCGKSLAGSQRLTGLIRERRVGKFYQAVLAGWREEPGELTAWLKKDEKRNRVYLSDRPAEGAEQIRTGFVPLRLGSLPGVGKVTWGEVQLFSGKTHQIRAHLAWLGHPLLGDPKYGNPELNRALAQRCGVRRQLLHACRAEFPPGEGLPEQIICPLSPDFAGVIGQL
ncbi:MAG: RluA family pseudouridine synthase [Eubacteriales bacterium]|nr:RluA family pseudouridine synthase [Eubacteriales bacterium]